MKEMNKTPKTDWVAPIILLIIAICAQVALFKLNDYLGTVTQKNTEVITATEVMSSTAETVNSSLTDEHRKITSKTGKTL